MLGDGGASAVPTQITIYNVNGSLLLDTNWILESGVKPIFVPVIPKISNRCLRLVIEKQSPKNNGADVPSLALCLTAAMSVQGLDHFPGLEAFRGGPVG